MNTTCSLIRWVSIIACTFSLSFGSLCAAAAKIELKDLPEPVQKGIKAKAGNKTISSITKKGKGDATTYVATVKGTDGNTGVITVGADGKFVKSKEEAVMKDLPEAVQTTIKARAGAKTISKVEKKGKGDKTTYAATVKGSDAKEELITVDAKGRFVKVEDVAAKKADKTPANPPAK